MARSYALRSRRPAEPYDVFADVRSQVYGGVLAETDATNAAVRSTRGRVVMAGGEIAQTFFFSTSGGRTAGNEEAFGGSPISYLRPVDDPHDDLSPYHTWTARFTQREAERKLGDALLGDLLGLRVATPHAVGPRRDRARARQRRQPDRRRGHDPDPVGASEHVDHARSRVPEPLGCAGELRLGREARGPRGLAPPAQTLADYPPIRWFLRQRPSRSGRSRLPKAIT